MGFAVDVITEKSPDSLLTAAVLPTLEELEEEPGLARFHFTRPETDGVRIRLHLEAPEGVPPDTLRETARAALERRLERLGADWRGAVSLQLGDDPVEVAAYGGPVGWALCARQFELSSRAVLDAMDHFDNWRSEHILGVALPLHLGFAAASGFDRRQAAAFFSDLAQRRYPDAPTLREEMEATFEAALEGHRAEVEPVVDLIWNTFFHDDALGEPWADRFYLSMRSLTDDLLQAHRDDRLDLPEECAWPAGDRLGTPLWPLGGLLFDQVHETDRRLGLGGADEIYLSHLLGEVLQRD